MNRESDNDAPVKLTAAELKGAFSAPGWLRDVGVSAWLLVGVALFLVGAVWLLSLTHVIVLPVITAAVVASVASPVVGWLQQHRVPRAVGAILMLLVLVGLAVGVIVVVIGGITSEAGDLKGHFDDARKAIEVISALRRRRRSWQGETVLYNKDAGSGRGRRGERVSRTGSARGSNSFRRTVSFLPSTMPSVLSLLKGRADDPARGERHRAVPLPVARVISSRVLQSLRGFFLGVTLVAALNAVVVVIGALLLGVPLAGTIGAATFLAPTSPIWAPGRRAPLPCRSPLVVPEPTPAPAWSW